MKITSFILEFIDVSVLAIQIIKPKTLIYDHIAIVLALGAQHRPLLSNFFKKQHLFLNSIPGYTSNVYFYCQL